MPRLPGRIRVLCVAAAAALLAAGCSGSGGSGAVGPLEKTNLVVAAVPAMDSAGLYIAQQRGYFAQEGLHVTIEPAISSADVIKKQLAGKFDITAGAYPSYILADEAHHANLKVLVAGSTMAPNVQEVVVPPGSKITKMSQLAGKTITLNALNNIGQLLVDAMLQDNAVPGTPHYNVQPFPAMGPLLAQHKLTAAWLPEPFISEFEEKYGVQPLADANQGAAESLPIEGYVVTQSWLNKIPAHRRSVQDRDGEGAGRGGHQPRRGADGHDRVRAGPEAGRRGAAVARLSDQHPGRAAAAGDHPDGELRPDEPGLQRGQPDRQDPQSVVV